MSRNYYKTGRRDDNEVEIKECLFSLGYDFMPLYPGQGADILLFLDHGVAFIEVKNPDASVKRKLGTEIEQWLRSVCEQSSVHYWIVEDVQTLNMFLSRVSA